jgi:YaiO family outer membrane protein
MGPVLRLAHRPLVLGAIAAALTAPPAPVAAQPTDSAAATPSQPPAVVSSRPVLPPWTVTLSGYVNAVDNGFGTWRGQDLRILHTGRLLSPFVQASTQTRPGGRQAALTAGSYVTLTRNLYVVAAMGVAPDRGVVLFPRRRSDLTLFLIVPRFEDLVVGGGVTDVRYTDPRIGGTIGNLTSTLYRRRAIYSATTYVNRDRASGALSGAWQVNAQWGQQERHWVGAGIGAGNEAYRLLLDVPFDARFSSRSATLWATKWLAADFGVTLRAEVEQKLDVYWRKGLSLSLFTEF